MNSSLYQRLFLKRWVLPDEELSILLFDGNPSKTRQTRHEFGIEKRQEPVKPFRWRNWKRKDSRSAQRAHGVWKHNVNRTNMIWMLLNWKVDINWTNGTCLKGS